MQHRTRKNMKFQFDEETRRIIYYRDDESCIFCRRQYHMENKDPITCYWTTAVKDSGQR